MAMEKDPSAGGGKSASAVVPYATSSSQNIATQVQTGRPQTLMSAVAKVEPSVVSIIVSEKVPQLELQYQSPDPSADALGIPIPVYKQVGTTTEQVAAGSGFFIRSNGY